MTKRTPPKTNHEQRRHLAELLRERIYSTISLLAVVVVLWQYPETHSPWGSVG